LGWTEGRNLRLDYGWGASADNPDRIRRYAIELVALAPDVIVAGSGVIAVELKRTSRTVPIVFPTANDPVGVGLVESLQRPGGNATGFSGFEIGADREISGTAQADCAERDASRCYSQSHQRRWECKF
jgi:putative tryptophan/tyrosine transport system substrate-binding protein